MPHDDYTASTGGALKLKGVGSASKISKPHKKKRPKPSQPAEFSDRALGTEEQAEKVVEDESVGERSLSMKDRSEQRKNDEVDGMRMGEEDVKEGVILRTVGKTEAERRHEERRRKRVCEILLLISNSDRQVFSTVKPSARASPYFLSCNPSTTSTLYSISISLVQLSLTDTVSSHFLTPT